MGNNKFNLGRSNSIPRIQLDIGIWAESLGLGIISIHSKLWEQILVYWMNRAMNQEQNTSNYRTGRE